MQSKFVPNHIDFVWSSMNQKRRMSCPHSIIRPTQTNIADVINCAQEYNGEFICYLLDNFEIIEDPAIILSYFNIYRQSEIISVDYKINHYSIVYPKETSTIRPFFIRRTAYKPYAHKNLKDYLATYNFHSRIPIEIFVKHDSTYLPS